MKFLITFACLLAVAYAFENAEVLKDIRDADTVSYNTQISLSNSIDSKQSGKLNGDEWIVEGDSAFTSPEGEKVAIKYIANANGYQVLDAQPPLPTPPPIPEPILRAIDYIQQHPNLDAQKN
ncbi:cuticular protein 47Eg [Drosophila hydei]|uniref:Cuticular protein 47Eg n=1 Tax=Drosophila hydei TaxID=7224 RepID=A0A6J1MDG5_DROHY|nr:cuticular protein 47Eg [Drosophila hydei]